MTKKTATVFNNFFSNIIKNLGIPQYNEIDPGSQVERDEIMKEISRLNINKATQSTDIPRKRIKENSDIFGDFIFENYNNCISSFVFPSYLKNDIKRVKKHQKIIIDL